MCAVTDVIDLLLTICRVGDSTLNETVLRAPAASCEHMTYVLDLVNRLMVRRTVDGGNCIELNMFVNLHTEGKN